MGVGSRDTSLRGAGAGQALPLSNTSPWSNGDFLPENTTHWSNGETLLVVVQGGGKRPEHEPSIMCSCVVFMCI